MSHEYKQIIQELGNLPIRGDKEFNLQKEKGKILETIERNIELQVNEVIRIYHMEIDYNQKLATKDNIHNDKTLHYCLKLQKARAIKDKLKGNSVTVPSGMTSSGIVSDIVDKYHSNRF